MLFVDGRVVGTFAPRTAFDRPPSVTVRRGRHRIGYAPLGSAGPTASTTAQLGPEQLYNPGATACYWEPPIGGVMSWRGRPERRSELVYGPRCWFEPASVNDPPGLDYYQLCTDLQRTCRAEEVDRLIACARSQLGPDDAHQEACERAALASCRGPR